MFRRQQTVVVVVVFVFRERGRPAAERDPGNPPERVLFQPEGGGGEPDAGGPESDPGLPVQAVVPGKTAVSSVRTRRQHAENTCSGSESNQTGSWCHK